MTQQNTASPADFDGNDESFSRNEQAQALVKAFFSIGDDWGLGPEDMRQLLGNPSRSRFYELRKGEPRAVQGVSEDELDRLAYLSGIYYGLEILFSPENRLLWLRSPAIIVDGFIRPWGETPPLTYLLSGKMEALIDVYRYVNGLRGG